MLMDVIIGWIICSAGEDCTVVCLQGAHKLLIRQMFKRIVPNGIPGTEVQMA